MVKVAQWKNGVIKRLTIQQIWIIPPKNWELCFCYHTHFNPECNTERHFIDSLSIALGSWPSIVWTNTICNTNNTFWMHFSCSKAKHLQAIDNWKCLECNPIMSKGKSPEVPFHRNTSSYSYFEFLCQLRQNMIKNSWTEMKSLLTKPGNVLPFHTSNLLYSEVDSLKHS